MRRSRPNQKTFVILAAGGKSKRMGVDKLHLPVSGTGAIYKVLSTLLSSRYIDGCVIATNENNFLKLSKYIKSLNTKKYVKVVRGGNTRADSVYNALQQIPKDTDFVAVHDAARPMLSLKLLDNVIKSAYRYKAVIPATQVKSTIKQISGAYVQNTPERSTLIDVQTPQCFEFKTLKEAYRIARTQGITPTDDSSVIENTGIKVRVIEGEYKNLKITTPEDYHILKAFENQITRVGFGFDVHRFVSGRALMLGCIKIPFQLGLSGHSDADVVVHSVADALLGASGLDDIGRHFPNTKRWKNISGEELLKSVYNIIKKKGLSPSNIDCTIVLEKPKIAIYKNKIRAKMADILNLKPEDIAIKATTAEGLGAVGRMEGACCYAIAVVKKNVEKKNGLSY